jgi:hypothetical protein
LIALGKRDVINAIGIDVFENMDLMERANKLIKASEVYADEFNEQGLERLGIIRKKSEFN